LVFQVSSSVVEVDGGVVNQQPFFNYFD